MREMIWKQSPLFILNSKTACYQGSKIKAYAVQTWTACVAQNRQQKKKHKNDVYVMLFQHLCNSFLSNTLPIFVFSNVPCLLVCSFTLWVNLTKTKKIHWAIHCQTKIEERQKQTSREHIFGWAKSLIPAPSWAHRLHVPKHPPPQFLSSVTLSLFKRILESDTNSKSELMTSLWV